MFLVEMTNTVRRMADLAVQFEKFFTAAVFLAIH